MQVPPFENPRLVVLVVLVVFVAVFRLHFVVPLILLELIVILVFVFP